MALETLFEVKEIGGFPVKHLGKKEHYGNPSDAYIHIRHDVNQIEFLIQRGAIKEAGVNGCQVETLIEAAKLMIDGLNTKLPCGENNEAIHHLNLALNSLKERKKDREERGVEGTNQP